MMADQYTSDATTAWKELEDHAGLEPAGRDADLAERLRVLLQPSAPDLASALLGRTAQDLLAAFFDAQQDFVTMLRDILAFYEAAGAKWGKQQWRLEVDAEALGLGNFREFLTHWEDVPYEVDVPAIDLAGTRAIIGAAHNTIGFPYSDDLDLDDDDAGDEEIADWFDALDLGEYRPLPRSLRNVQTPGPVADAVALTAATLDIVRRAWPDRQAMLDEHRARNYASDIEDGLSPRSVAQEETDFRLKFNIEMLRKYMDVAPDVQRKFEDNLRQRYDAFPRRRLHMTASIARLKELLSLPVWKRRHELYAVWIGTELVRAMDGHDCELHHDAGTIRFGFSKTLLATVHSTEPKIRLYAERRSRLDLPVGTERVEGAQPDFSLWRGLEPGDTCGLVVEVKHYKKNASRSFGNALIDYARAHPYADVVLVNHGAARVTFRDEHKLEARRCDTIGHLTASNAQARANLARQVGNLVGKPVVRFPLPQVRSAVVLDISASMRGPVKDYRMPDFLDALAGSARPELILVDDAIRRRGPLRELAPQLAAGLYYDGTGFQEAFGQILDEFDEVVVVTDQDGLKEVRGLDGVSVREDVPIFLSWAQLYVVRVERGRGQP
jgi:hypothetical protein